MIIQQKNSVKIFKLHEDYWVSKGNEDPLGPFNINEAKKIFEETIKRQNSLPPCSGFFFIVPTKSLEQIAEESITYLNPNKPENTKNPINISNTGFQNIINGKKSQGFYIKE